MPPTPGEMVTIARRLLDHALAPDALADVRWQDGSSITEPELADVVALALYEARSRASRRNPAQRRAMRLLRSLLTPEQRAALRTGRAFRVQGSEGGLYRLYPGSSIVEGIEKHGKHFFAVRSFCLHEPPGAEPLPTADRTVAHLLLLLTDEAEFARTANVTERPPGCWDNTWRRRLNEARARRESTPDPTPCCPLPTEDRP